MSLAGGLNFVPKKVFFTKGVGYHETELGAFERALRNAGIAQFNLVQVSSIFPPKAEIISREEGLKLLRPGQIVFAVMARNSSNEYNRLIAASVGLAIPKDRNLYGYLSEHHSYGEDEQEAGDFAEDLAAEMLVSSLGMPEERLKWDENKNLYKLDERILITRNITQTAVVRTRGEWAAVIAAAILLL